MSNELGFVNNQQESNSLMHVNESRAVAEVQAAYVIAKKFPRNDFDAYARIMKACERPYLAEQAMYAYPRGNQTVTGPSIRLAETMAQAWGNIDFGIRELSQENGVSVAEAYAIDLQTNTRLVKIFHVPHVRDTKKGKYKLTDSRDIYEIVANQGARRLRACILGIIPGDVVEAAVQKCRKTLESSTVPMAEQIRKLVAAFDEIGVKVEHIEALVDHSIDLIIPAEIATLRSIYKAIHDGVADRTQYFDIANKQKESASDLLQEAINKANNQEK